MRAISYLILLLGLSSCATHNVGASVQPAAQMRITEIFVSPGPFSREATDVIQDSGPVTKTFTVRWENGQGPFIFTWGCDNPWGEGRISNVISTAAREAEFTLTLRAHLPGAHPSAEIDFSIVDSTGATLERRINYSGSQLRFQH